MPGWHVGSASDEASADAFLIPFHTRSYRIWGKRHALLDMQWLRQDNVPPFGGTQASGQSQSHSVVVH